MLYSVHCTMCNALLVFLVLNPEVDIMGNADVISSNKRNITSACDTSDKLNEQQKILHCSLARINEIITK